MMSRKFKVGDYVEAQHRNETYTDIITSAGKGVYRVGNFDYFEWQLTLIRAADEPAKAYKGQFEVGSAPSFNKMLDSLTF